MDRLMVTGHRPQHIPGQKVKPLKDEIGRVLDKANPLIGVSGMAAGTDLWFARACIERDIPLWAFIPFVGQADQFHPTDADEWVWCIDRATTIIDCAPKYVRGVYNKRNQMMVDFVKQAPTESAALAVWDSRKKTGGTYDCVNRIKRAGLAFIHIDVASSPPFKTTYGIPKVVV